VKARTTENFLDKLIPKILMILSKKKKGMYSKIFFKVDTKVGLNLPKGSGKLNRQA
jgi:hypothetical protein